MSAREGGRSNPIFQMKVVPPTADELAVEWLMTKMCAVKQAQTKKEMLRKHSGTLTAVVMLACLKRRLRKSSRRLIRHLIVVFVAL